MDWSQHDLIRYKVFNIIEKERANQLAKWGEQDHTDAWWLVILLEEVGEVARNILEGENVNAELAQVAAVAVAWLENREQDNAK